MSEKSPRKESRQVNTNIEENGRHTYEETFLVNDNTRSLGDSHPYCHAFILDPECLRGASRALTNRLIRLISSLSSARSFQCHSSPLPQPERLF